jgi:hypothetical protein
MRRWLLLLVMAGMALGNAGCLINMYSSDPQQRMHELLTVSENERIIQEQWERIWFVDQPSHLNPQRITGGIQ